MRRTCAFTASFVLTAAVAPACTKDTKDADRKPPPADQKPPREPIVNPPAPGSGSAKPTDWAPHPDHPDALVPSERTLRLAHSKIELDANFVCTEYFFANCDPGVKCNPPQPRVVDPCPPELHPRAAPGAQIETRDSRCFTVDGIRVVCP